MVKIFIKCFFLWFFGISLAQVEVGETFTVTMTAYSSTRSQTDSTPFITSTNQRVRSGIVAASRDLLVSDFPYGSKLRVVAIEDTRSCGGWDPGMTLEVQDTMHPRKQNQIDLWLPSTARARKWGRCKVKIEILGSIEETLVQTPNTSKEQIIAEEVTESNLQPDLEQLQQANDFFIEAANKVSIASFNFEVTHAEVEALTEVSDNNTITTYDNNLNTIQTEVLAENNNAVPTYDINTQTEVLVEVNDINTESTYDNNLSTIQTEALAENNNAVPTYDINTQTEVLVEVNDVNTASTYGNNLSTIQTETLTENNNAVTTYYSNTQAEVFVETNDDNTVPTYDNNLSAPNTIQTEALAENNNAPPTYDINTQTKVVEVSNDNSIPTYDNLGSDGIQHEILVEANNTVTYDANIDTPNTTQATIPSAPKQQSLMEMASQAFLVPLLHFAFSAPDTSEETLNYYTNYYMQNSP